MATENPSWGFHAPAGRFEESASSRRAIERRIVVVDVEATCWKKGVFSRRKETIEIGAVLLPLDRAPLKWLEFQTFVRPQRLPCLSSFCHKLTGITQENVDAAPTFPEALRLFLEWAQPLARRPGQLEPLRFVAARSSFPRCEELAARSVGSKSFEAIARELVPDGVGMPRLRAVPDAVGPQRSCMPCSVPKKQLDRAIGESRVFARC